jgi:tetratricopeptide (TPR) repeat protein
LSAIGALAIGTTMAQTPAAPAVPAVPAPKAPAEQPAAIPAPGGITDKEFTNLPEEKRKEFYKHLLEASKLFSQKRIFEALDEVTKAEAIFPDNAELANIKGSCYVEFRDFPKARQIFEEALKLSPDSSTVLFNIAEVDFCARNWAKAEKEFTELMPKLAKGQSSMKDLIEFKILLCKLKNNKGAEARKMVDNHGFMDDTPYYFFAKAAISFNNGDTVAAEEWLGRALRIFRNPRILAPWQDTLIEFGYIKSFYGGDLGDGEE